MQTSLDAKHSLFIDYKVTCENGSKAMGNMAHRAKAIPHTTGFTALYDNSYRTGSEQKTARELGATAGRHSCSGIQRS